MMRLRFLAPAVLALACTSETASRADSAAASADSVSTDVGANTPAPAPEAPVDASTWQVNARGIGPISAGMTLVDANKAAGTQLVFPAKMEECDYIRLMNGPDGLMFMVEKGTISRVDVTRDATITTEAGAKIGDTEAKIKSLYPGVQIQPHKYTDGHYLVVTPSATADQAYRIVFETDGEKVLRYRSGRMPAVEYVEGCS